MDEEAVVTLLPNQALLEPWNGLEDLEDVDAFLITLRCVAQWADRCAIWPLLGEAATAGYDGELPADATAREAVVERAYREVGDWLDRHDPGYRLVAAILWAGARELLDNHDATWASYSEIHLTPTQIEALRACWRQHGLPPDLYIPGQPIADRRIDQ